VNYVTFSVGADGASRLRDDSARAAIEIRHPAYHASTELPTPTRAELASDFEG
jgi:hypothetical protein